MRYGLLTLFLTVLAATPLWSASWQIASISATGGDGGFHALVLRQIDRHLSRVDLHHPEWEIMRKEEERTWNEWQAWAKAYDSLTLPVWADESRISTDNIPREVKLTDLDADQTLVSLAREGKLSWFCDAYGYDEVLFDETTSFAGRTRCQLFSYVRASDSMHLLVDKLSFLEDASDLEADVALQLVSFHQTEKMGAITLGGAPPNVQVEIDGNKVLREGSLFLLPPGPHLVELSANGYESKRIEIETSVMQQKEIDASLVPLKLATLNAVSEDGVVSWFVDGIPYGTSSSLSLLDPQLPLLITAQKNGYLSTSHQLTEDRGIVHFQLEKDWMRNPKVTQDVQKQFYNSFVSLICCVGLTLAYPTLYNVYGDEDYLSGGLYVLCQGSTIMSAISLVRSLFSYSENTMQQ